MKRIIAMFVKEIKLFYREPTGFVLLFVLPAIFIFVLSLSLQGAFSTLEKPKNKEDKLNLLFLNEDRGELGEKIIQGVESIGYFNPVIFKTENSNKFEEAKKELKKGKYKVLVYIPKETTDAFGFQNKAVISILIDPVLPNNLASDITNSIQNFVYISISQNIGKISKNIFDSIKFKRKEEIQKQLNETQKKRKSLDQEFIKINESEIDEYIKSMFIELINNNIKDLDSTIKDLKSQLEEVNNKKYDSENFDFTNFENKNIGVNVNQTYYIGQSDSEIFPTSVQQNVPGWTIFALFWIIQIISISIINEKQSGAFKRLLISPITSFQYFTGKIIPFFFINVLQAVVMFCIGIFILPLFGSPGLVIKDYSSLIAVTVAISFTSISLGLLLASICDNLLVAASLSVLIIILSTVFGGIMIPKFIMPKFMQNLTLIVPQGWALDAYLNIFVKNYNVIQVLPNILVLLGFSLVFFILSFFFFKKNTDEN